MARTLFRSSTNEHLRGLRMALQEHTPIYRTFSTYEHHKTQCETFTEPELPVRIETPPRNCLRKDRARC